MIRIDQAHQLRLLASEGLPRQTGGIGRTQLLAVVGGKGGVGTTTIALNVAAALARRAYRTLLVDADPDGPDVAVMCRLEPRGTLADVLQGRLDLPRALASGPWGLEILCGESDPQRGRLPGDDPWARLLVRLGEKTPPPHWVVADVGDRCSCWPHRLAREADLLVLVTGPERPAIVDTYGTIKALRACETRRPVRLVVNAAESHRQAQEVFCRLDRTCQRFLGGGLELAGWVGRDPAVSRAVSAGQPVAVVAPRSRAAWQLERLAGRLASVGPHGAAPSPNRAFSEAPAGAGTPSGNSDRKNASSRM